MPKAFLLCDVNKFNTDNFEVPMIGSLVEFEGDPEINFKINKHDFHDGFDQYSCHHDYKVKTFGKVYNNTFNYYFLPKDFNMFYNKNSKLIIISLKSDIALDFIKNLNQHRFFDLSPIKIDFKAIAPYITEMSGVWVSGLNRTHVKTVGYFGPYVNKSEEFIEASREGEVSSVQMQYVYPKTGEEHTINISQKGTITLYDNFERIEDELDIIISVYNNIIKLPLLSGRK